jgi:hypothetical protein
MARHNPNIAPQTSPAVAAARRTWCRTWLRDAVQLRSRYTGQRIRSEQHVMGLEAERHRTCHRIWPQGAIQIRI